MDDYLIRDLERIEREQRWLREQRHIQDTQQLAARQADISRALAEHDELRRLTDHAAEIRSTASRLFDAPHLSALDMVRGAPYDMIREAAHSLTASLDREVPSIQDFAREAQERARFVAEAWGLDGIDGIARTFGRVVGEVNQHAEFLRQSDLVEQLRRVEGQALRPHELFALNASFARDAVGPNDFSHISPTLTGAFQDLLSDPLSRRSPEWARDLFEKVKVGVEETLDQAPTEPEGRGLAIRELVEIIFRLLTLWGLIAGYQTAHEMRDGFSHLGDQISGIEASLNETSPCVDCLVLSASSLTEEPSAGSKALRAVTRGESVTVEERTGAWVRVRHLSSVDGTIAGGWLPEAHVSRE